MSSTALDEGRYERVAPTWEAGQPEPGHPTPSRPGTSAGRVAIIVGAILAVATATLAAAAVIAGFAFGLPMGGGVGERTPHPQSAAALADGFKLGAGALRVDLRDVAFPDGVTRTKVELGFGEATVTVPEGVDVVVNGEVLAGRVVTFGRDDDGFDVDTTHATPTHPGAPRLEIDAKVGFGQLRVERG